MNQKNNLKFLILLFPVFCIVFGKGVYKPKSFSSVIMLGHDSNPLRLSKNEMWLDADNNKFDPIKVTEEMNFHVWGIATNVIHKL